MSVLTGAFFWYLSPLGLGFRFVSDSSADVQIAKGIYHFSYLILNPAMVLAWMALPLFRKRGLADFGWRLLGLIFVLLVGCIAAIFAIV
jgi:hypothetical protein